MMDPLFQEKLMRGLRDAVGHFNSGMSPTEAVTKSAGAYSFNPEQATRLAETFNTARTIYHFDKNATSDDKGGTFELADPAAVVLSLFGPKEAKKEAAALFDYSGYDRVPKNHTLADVDISFTKKSNEMDDLRMDNQGYRIRKVLATYRTMAEDAQSKAAMAELKASQILEKLAGEISRGHLYGSAEKLERLQAVTYTNTSCPVWRKFATYLPKGMVNLEPDNGPARVVPAADIEDWIAIVKRAQDLMEQSAEMLAISAGLEKDAADLDKQFTSMFMTGVPSKSEGEVSDFFTLAAKVAFDPDTEAARGPAEVFNTWNIGDRARIFPGVTSITEGTKDKSSPKGDEGVTIKWPETDTKGLDQALSPFTGAIGNVIGGQAEKGVTDLIEGDILEQNKKITARLRNMQRKVILEDLMSHDPVLRDAEPQQIADAYQAIMQLAPNVSINKEVVRAILRQTIHSQAISPFDANTFLGLEKTIKEVAGTMPPQRRVDTKR